MRHTCAVCIDIVRSPRLSHLLHRVVYPNRTDSIAYMNQWHRTYTTSRIAHVSESCPTYKWVTLRIWMSHVTHISRSRDHMWSQVAWLRFSRLPHRMMCHDRTCHVTHTNESYHVYEWVTSHVRMSHAPRTNESHPTFAWVTLLLRKILRLSRLPRRLVYHNTTGHVAHTNASYRTYEWVTSNVWLSHMTHIWHMN